MKNPPYRSIVPVAVSCMMTVTLAACGSSSSPKDAPVVVVDDADPSAPRTRYSLNNQCFALRSAGNDQYVNRQGGGYAAGAADVTGAEAFFLKPTALGEYLLVNRDGLLLTADGGTSNSVPGDRNPAALITVTGLGDNTAYPPAPTIISEPTNAELVAYREFVDPNFLATNFLLTTGGQALAVDAENALTTAAPSGGANQQFIFEAVTGCTEFPEANNNVASGQTFSGTTPDGRVLGMTDAHVHISSTDFLGGAQHGMPFDKFGVTQAVGDCAVTHGQQGSSDFLAASFSGDTDGHATAGWPTFPEWPARDALTHEAIYWKWLERAYMAGLRVIVNDVVENTTLCEITRNTSSMDASQDCNSMNKAAQQVGTMFAMQDYIDAQYGGRGEGWLEIAWDSTEARSIIEDGRAAMILGIEISNLFNCQVNHAPTASRTQQPFEEDGMTPGENTYSCDIDTVTEQAERLWDLGIRQIITIHEFDNAFGGNGIFDDLILNVGSRENSGGIDGELASNPLATAFAGPELPTGEFWTTYDCPQEDTVDGFRGYLWRDDGGTVMQSIEPVCPFQGQGDGPGTNRPGGPTTCYPRAPQCNARWLTPLRLDMYGLLMEMGFIFDIDHLEIEMKTQALELAEAQDPPYPFVSTHGDFGGTTIDQAERIILNGGVLYPSIGSTEGFLRDMAETRELWDNAPWPVVDGVEQRFDFGFGFGTDTNGLSAQQSPRSSALSEARPIVYPYTLFSGGLFDQLDDFDNVDPVVFNQPEERNAGGEGRTWHQDVHGNATFGMMSGMVQEMNLEGTAQDMQDLFNSAEVYLQMWARTEASNAGIRAKTENDTDGDGLGEVVVPDGILRPAPLPANAGRQPPG